MVDKPQENETLVIPSVLPLLPVRDVVVFPYMILPLFVGREVSIQAVDEALAKDRLIFVAAQRDVNEEEPSAEGVYRVGTVATIMRMLKLADGRVKVLVQGLAKARVLEVLQQRPSMTVRLEQIPEQASKGDPLEVEALVRNVREQMRKIASVGKNVSADLLMVMENMNEPGRLADLIASNLGFSIEEAQKVLEILEPISRLRRVHELLNKEVQVLTMQARIESQVRDEMTKSQKEQFLREQMRAIRHELGEADDKFQEIQELREKIQAAKMPPEVEKEADKQVTRLDQMHPESAEAAIVRTYLDWLIEIPWSKSTEDTLDLKKAKQILDEDHFDLEKVKERILDYLAVHKLKEKMKGPILCFVGPPGVGKTSLGRSIARAMGRKFVRISLGGIRDEAEIRGHRRTYVGAMPGRIVQGIKQAGSNNPVFMMDEVDKIGADFRGDPSAALLEALDPEQNFAFSDHYLNLPFDLSNVMFILTANLLDPIPAALRDRMEVIHLSGYTPLEKIQITKRWLVPRQLKENGLIEGQLRITDSTIHDAIFLYTREAGLRNLEREIGTLCRKVARRVAEGEAGPFLLSRKSLAKYLGIPKFLPEEEREEGEVGVATGLAWTEFGGEILYIEATTMKGKGNLTITGSLGEVMKESAQAAVSYARSRARNLNIDPDFFEKSDIHIHVPAGAIPKDGPSAGVVMATAIISAITKVPVRSDVAMTGEITLRGRVLPIGGLKEKSLAALRANIPILLAPHQNAKDLEDIPIYVRKRIDFRLVKHMDEILDVALVASHEEKESSQGAPVPPQKTKPLTGRPREKLLQRGV